MTQILRMLMQMEKRNEKKWNGIELWGHIQATCLIPQKSLCKSNQLKQLNTEA